MNLFELLFLLLALATLISLLTAGALALGSQLGRAGRILGRLGIGAAAYFTVVIVVSIAKPRRVYHVGDMQCFDDWCITLVDVRKADSPPGATLEVSLRLSNQSKGTPMGEKGTVAFLTDKEGRRYDPQADPSDVPFDTRLQPGQSVMTTRRFKVRSAAEGLGFIYTHQGGFPIGWLIIGEGGWFGEPAIVRLE
jgi:hypothetical protein